MERLPEPAPPTEREPQRRRGQRAEGAGLRSKFWGQVAKVGPGIPKPLWDPEQEPHARGRGNAQMALPPAPTLLPGRLTTAVDIY